MKEKFLTTIKGLTARVTLQINKEKKDEDVKTQKGEGTQKKDAKKSRPMRMRLSISDQMLFAKRLSFLVGANVPLLESFHMLQAQTHSRRLKALYQVIIGDISNGQSLSSALKKFGSTFGAFTINIIKIGESSGTLSQNLMYLAEELKKRHLLRKKIISALVYPIIITVATLLIAGLLTVFIFPKIMPIFTSLNVTLPWSTRALLWLSLFLKEYGIWLIVGIIITIFGIGILRRLWFPFRFVMDRLVLALPFSGAIARSYNMANYSRTLGILLKSGLPVAEALHIGAETIENRAFRRAARTVAGRSLSGKQLSDLLAEQHIYFPQLLFHMVGVGERTGNLSGSLTYLADFYESEVDEMTRNLSSAIEPVLMIVMGLLVGFVAVSVITPIYEITQTLQR